MESSTTMMNRLPEELIKSEILTRLPVKSLMRFKSVSKSWYALFQSQNFITAHRLFHQNNNTRVLVNGLTLEEEQVLSVLSDETLELESYLYVPDVGVEECKIDDIRLVGSCSVNGIMCLLMNELAPFLLNPATSEFKLLPSSNPYESEYRNGYDGYGFGYDPIADDYKVVRNGSSYGYNPIPYNVYLEIYSLRSDSWKLLDADGLNFSLRCKGDVLLNGMFHWMTRGGDSYDKMLLSFDISTEIFCTTYAPHFDGDDDDGDKDMMEEIVSLKGSIAMITFDNKLSTGRLFDVWILGEVGVKESWTKHLTIGPLFNVEKPIGVGKSGEIFFLKALSLENDDDNIAGSKDAEAACYDPNTQMLRNLGFKLHGGTSAVAIYSESLVSLQKILEDAGN